MYQINQINQLVIDRYYAITIKTANIERFEKKKLVWRLLLSIKHDSKRNTVFVKIILAKKILQYKNLIKRRIAEKKLK